MKPPASPTGLVEDGYGLEHQEDPEGLKSCKEALQDQIMGLKIELDALRDSWAAREGLLLNIIEQAKDSDQLARAWARMRKKRKEYETREKSTMDHIQDCYNRLEVLANVELHNK